MRANLAADPGTIEPGWLTAAASILSGLLGAFGLWLAQRTLGKAGLQTAINQGFRELMQAEREALQSVRDELKAERAARVKEQLATSHERDQLRGEIANLNQTIESLTDRLRDAGIEGLILEPEAPKRRPKPMIEL